MILQLLISYNIYEIERILSILELNLAIMYYLNPFQVLKRCNC